MKKTTSKLAMCIVGMAISGAVLIWLIPPVFSANGQGNFWIMGALGLIFVVFAVGARYWKKAMPSTGGDN